MSFSLMNLLIVIWTIVGLCLLIYLISFPIFMKKNMSKVTSLLERIAFSLESKNKN